MKSLRTLEAVGAVLTIVGSFLPWEYSGGCFGQNIPGIRVYLEGFKYWGNGVQTFPVNDHGGVLVIFLTLAIIFLTLHPPRFIKNPILWKLVLSAVLLASSLFFVGRRVFHVYINNILFEPSSLMFGLFFVVVGSVLLLWEAVKVYRETVRNDNNPA
jgi:hypothetical protein